MKKIGLLSDTHGFIDEKLKNFFKDCDEIWHAGDAGNYEILEELAQTASVRAVYGNIDGQDIRKKFPKHNRFKCEDTNIWITHIGGYPGKYDKNVKPEIYRNPPDIFISGHSHILKVIYDKQINCLHINPGAYGNSGMHKVKTAVRFQIAGKDIKELEILEIQRK